VVKRITLVSQDDNDNVKDINPNFLYEKCDCYSWHDFLYRYKVGKNHKPIGPLNMDIWKECASGIHFFDNRRC